MNPEKTQRLGRLRDIALQCRACPLVLESKKMVFSDGDPDAALMFIGEAPGRDEDASGVPFVGRSGKLLRELIKAVGLNPVEDCYIANIVKHRPPGNREPAKEEIEICVKYLRKQIEIIAPKFIVLLGRTAVKGLLPLERSYESIEGLRARSRVAGQLDYMNIPVAVTYHPSALLRDPSKKSKVLEDFRFIYESALEDIAPF